MDEMNVFKKLMERERIFLVLSSETVSKLWNRIVEEIKVINTHK